MNHEQTSRAAGQSRAQQMGLHAEQLAGRTQQIYFSPSAEERFTHPYAYEVDFDRSAEIDAASMTRQEINVRIRELMKEGYGSLTVRNPQGKHSLGVGILNRLNLTFEGSLGYFCCGLIDGPMVHVTGRVGWSCGENMMAGSIVIDKSAGSQFGAAIRGGDLVCHGDVGSRTGINQKGGTIIVGGDTGAFSGFMMQRGRIIVFGNASENLGDSMYDGAIFIAGKISSLGVDAVEAEITPTEAAWIKSKLAIYGMQAPCAAEKMSKIVSGKQLWNYDNLEPSEKKLIL